MINCENCGAPVSASASANTVTCTHCGHTSQVPRAGGGASSGGGSGGGGGVQAIPQIVVVNTSAPAPVVRSAPVIVVRRGYRRSSFSIFGFVLTMVIFYSVYWYTMRMRNNIAASVNQAEHAQEHASEKPKSKK